MTVGRLSRNGSSLHSDSLPTLPELPLPSPQVERLYPEISTGPCARIQSGLTPINPFRIYRFERSDPFAEYRFQPWAQPFLVIGRRSGAVARVQPANRTRFDDRF